MIKLFACALLLPMSVFAAVLKAPDELVFLAVNDQQVEKSWFSSANEVTLSLGKNVVKLKYLDLFEVDYDQHEIVESEPFWLEINVIDADKPLKIMFNKPDSVAAAKAFVSAPTKQLTLDGGHQQQNIFASKPHQIVNKIDSNHSAAEQVNQPLPLHVKASTQQGSEPNALNMLEFWWQQASIEQQKAFLNQIAKDK